MTYFRATLSLMTGLMLLVAGDAAAGSPKRGVCWDEHKLALSPGHAGLLSPGVSWVYNWGPDAAFDAAYGSDLSFEPMAWNGAYDASRIRAWLQKHPESRYLLGFNEPNFADQARMTPADAAAVWPELEALAEEFGVKLVAPALNFSASRVGDRVWSPYEWYDEFFRIYPDARVDCLALHCYMNWYTATAWFATEYFYADLYNPTKDCYGRYPHLTRFLDRYKDANGRFPRMMLTEFCAWENDGAIKDADFQIDQMTQKVQKLEQNDLVEGYAWFMANADSGAAAYPYMSILQSNTADSGLSSLGKVYVGMSAFDMDRYYAPSEVIAAKNYIDATTDDCQVKVRPNMDPDSDVDLQIEIPVSGYADYLIDVPSDGDYRFVFHVRADNRSSLTLYVDNKKSNGTEVVPTGGLWADVELFASLKSGRHRVMPYNSGSSPVLMNSMFFTGGNRVETVNDSDAKTIACIYDLSGRCYGNPRLSLLAPGIYLARYSDGSTVKFKI